LTPNIIVVIKQIKKIKLALAVVTKIPIIGLIHQKVSVTTQEMGQQE
jgi:hypothetical protein